MTDAYTANVFAGGHPERAVHRRKDAGWLCSDETAREALFVPVCDDHTLIDPNHKSPCARLLRFTEVSALELTDVDWIFLGEHQAQHYFALDCPSHAAQVLATYGRLESLRRHATLVAREDAGLLAYARAMVLWHRTHRYCPRCGAPTVSADGGHMRVCTRTDTCGARQFPRLDPAVIVLVSHAERCLLGRQPNWPPGRYSTVAGFVEPGEGLEDAVRREVAEETNVRVAQVRYHSSQPWPFPSSLMIGFTAEALNTDIRLNDQELEDARWFSREELLAQMIRIKAGRTMELSIAFRLIAHWYDGDRPGRLVSELEQALGEPG
ncbi:MAG: NAD(+) diphosphatase [Pseudomonadota bacterium]